MSNARDLFADRTWWCRERSALPLDAFRIVAGLLLLAHYLQHLFQLPEVLGAGQLYSPELSRVFWPSTKAGAILGASSVGMLRAFFGAGVLLAGAITIGFFARAAAALLLAFSVVTYWAIFPISGLDDVVATSLSLWLVLLPIGTTLCLMPQRFLPNRSKRSGRVSGHVVSLFLVYVMFLYGNVWMWQEYGYGAGPGPALTLALYAVPACFLAPVAFARPLGIVLGVGVALALYAATDLTLTPALVAASGLLFWGETRAEAGRERPIPTAAVVAASYLGLLVCFYAAGAFGPTPVHAKVQKLLADTGLAPTASGQRPVDGLVVGVKAFDAEEATPLLSIEVGDDVRAQTLLTYLNPELTVPEIRTAIAGGLANRFCASSQAFHDPAYLVAKSPAFELSVAWFECDPGGGDARVVLLGDAGEDERNADDKT